MRPGGHRPDFLQLSGGDRVHPHHSRPSSHSAWDPRDRDTNRIILNEHTYPKVVFIV